MCQAERRRALLGSNSARNRLGREFVAAAAIYRMPVSSESLVSHHNSENPRFKECAFSELSHEIGDQRNNQRFQVRISDVACRDQQQFGGVPECRCVSTKSGSFVLRILCSFSAILEISRSVERFPAGRSSVWIASHSTCANQSAMLRGKWASIRTFTGSPATSTETAQALRPRRAQPADLLAQGPRNPQGFLQSSSLSLKAEADLRLDA